MFRLPSFPPRLTSVANQPLLALQVSLPHLSLPPSLAGGSDPHLLKLLLEPKRKAARAAGGDRPPTPSRSFSCWDTLARKVRHGRCSDGRKEREGEGGRGEPPVLYQGRRGNISSNVYNDCSIQSSQPATLLPPPCQGRNQRNTRMQERCARSESIAPTT